MKLIKDSNGKVLISGRTVYGVTESIDQNIVSANILKGIKILDTVGTASDRISMVKFIDYDGTVLYSCSSRALLTFTEMPNISVQHPGLIEEGWNWTLNDAMIFLVDNEIDKDLVIGKTYTTTDGKSRFYITISSNSTEVAAIFRQSELGGVKVDWGDGNVSTKDDDTGRIDLYHTYATAGDYVVSFEVLSGTLQLGTNEIPVLRKVGWNFYPDIVKKIELGEVSGIGNYIARYPYLESITIPSGITSIGTGAFCPTDAVNSKLEAVVLPKGITAVGDEAFKNCKALLHASLPKEIVSMAGSTFLGCDSLMEIALGNGSLGNTGNYTFQQCSSLSRVSLPVGFSTISTNMFYQCYSLQEIELPWTVTSIGNEAFSDCYSLAKITIPRNVKEL